MFTYLFLLFDFQISLKDMMKECVGDVQYLEWGPQGWDQVNKKELLLRMAETWNSTAGRRTCKIVWKGHS